MQIDKAARPRMGRIPAAITYSGLSRSGLYLKAKKYRGLLRKDGNTTLVDFDVLDVVLNDLPCAETEGSERDAATTPAHQVEAEA